MILAEVMTYDGALLAGIGGLVGALGIMWAKLTATDKRQQAEFDAYKTAQDLELKECRELRQQFMNFLIGQTQAKQQKAQDTT